jgi:spore coat polysaccharide biosynthesis protein SpsF (cytidylyltransferase family)
MITAIIQARLGSSRLPGKTLIEIAGRPMLGHLVDRVRQIQGIEQVVIATTTRPLDQAIVDFGEIEGLPVYTGSEEDVLDRFYQAARRFNASVIVRVTPDCPLLDMEVSRQVLVRFLQGDVDYASNTNPPTFPDGLDTEVFSFAALEQAWREAKLPSEREHVTAYIWKNPDKFRLANVTHERDLSALRWTVDEAQDLAFMRTVYEQLGPDLFGMAAVLDLLETQPHLSKTNAAFERNEGYQKSLREDKLIGDTEAQ